MSFKNIFLRFKRQLRSRIASKHNQLDSLGRLMRLTIKGSGNRLSIGAGVDEAGLLRSRITILGSNNTVVLADGMRIKGRLSLAIDGSGNRVEIGKNVIIVDSLHIELLKGCSHASVTIGDNTSFWNCNIKNYDHASSVRIGEDCMFSYNTAIINTDEHLIFNNGKVCNRARELVIGNHVWVGYGACVLKNSSIADSSIIGRSAVVSGTFSSPKSVIVGNPGRVVKTGTEWSRTSVNEGILS